MQHDNELDNEFEDMTDDNDGGSAAPDAEDDTDDGFVELTEAEYAQLPLAEQRRYRGRLEAFKKELKRENARQRKQAERDRTKATGIAPGIANKLAAEQKASLATLQNDPAKVTELAELTERLAEFNYYRSEARSVIDRIRQGIHPEVEGPGRFFEMIAADYLEHAKRYGLTEYNPPFLITMRIELMHHARRNQALKELQSNLEYRYRINFGLDIDHISNLEYFEFMGAVFSWYLENRQRPDYDYDWLDADVLVNNFEIPAKLLKEPFGDGKSVWTRLDNYRRQVVETPYKIKTAAQILVDDDKVLKTLKDLGY